MVKKNVNAEEQMNEPVEMEEGEEKVYATVPERIAASIVDKAPGKEAVVIQFETVSPALTGGVPSGDIRFAIQADGALITGILNRYSKKAKLSIMAPQ